MRADIAGGPGGGINGKRTMSHDTGKLDTTSVVSLKPLVPGPGAYEIKGVIGSEGPKRSLAGRFKIDL